MNVFQRGSLSFCSLLLVSAAYPWEDAKGSANNAVTVIQEVLNVRGGPGVSYPVIGVLSRGKSYLILKEEGEWLKVQTEAGKEGYVAKWLATGNSKENKQPIGKGNIISEDVRVRTGPATSYNLAGTVSNGSTVEILEHKANWIHIRKNKLTGWIAEEYISQDSIFVNRQKELPARAIVSETVKVRTHASLEGEVLGKMARGSKVQIVTAEGDWLKVSYKSAYGWINKKYISFSGEKLKGTEPPAEGRNDKQHELQPSGTGKQQELQLPTTQSQRSKNKKQAALQPSITESLPSKTEQQQEEPLSTRIEKIQESWPSRTSRTEKPMDGEVVVTQNRTNLRSGPDIHASIVSRTYVGEKFSIIAAIDNDWYKIRLYTGGTAYVAGWVVSLAGNTPNMENQRTEQFLSDKLIVIDPGHGGKDQGTTGISGTLEKDLTLETAFLLQDKLKTAGATVLLTRNADSYTSLPARVGISNSYNADAYISLHYDHANNHLVSGVTTYYYHSYQKSLASSLSKSLGSTSQVVNRGYRFGDFHVIRENQQAAVLIELGYLSNPAEETTLKSTQYQEAASEAIYSGLENYFK